jgi:hypothetical protein
MATTAVPLTATPDDLQHLKWISIAHYVYGGLLCFGILWGLFFASMGTFIAQAPRQPGEPDPAIFSAIFGAIGVFFALIAAAMAVVTFLAGRFLKQRRNHTFCLIIAGLDCLWAPVGTVLGVFTFIVLFRPQVKALFEQRNHI